MSDYPKAVAAAWHPLAASKALSARPLARSLMGQPIVLFRGPDRPAALIDRCPHRNMALSRGRVRGGEIECPYHGWRFAAGGRCVATPGADQPARHGAQALPIVERAGLIWTCLADDPAPFPSLPEPMEDAGYDRFWLRIKPSRARLLDALENLLDPAHPHFLHPGMVRSADKRRPVEVTVRSGPDYAESSYVENAPASALMPRLLEGLRSTSVGRVRAPAIGQLVFEGPTGPRLAITVFFVPEAPDRVRTYAQFATPKGRAPAWLKQALLRVLHIPVIAQDQAALRAQCDNIQRFGGPRYASGPLDFLLPSISTLSEGQQLESGEQKGVVWL